MSLESNKSLGGIGSILMVIPFLNLLGIILVLIAMKGMADYYEDKDIFQNALYGFIFGIIGIIGLAAVIIIFVFGTIYVSHEVTPYAGIGIVIISIIVMWVFSLIGAVFYRQAFQLLSERSREHLFETAGIILLIGAIIPVVGEVLRFVAWILAGVGFFSIKTQFRKLRTMISEEKKFCQYCGAENKVQAAFCSKCGKKIG